MRKKKIHHSTRETNFEIMQLPFLTNYFVQQFIRRNKDILMLKFINQYIL
jgi:hypothetical protein